METSLSKSATQKSNSWITNWLLRENSLLTAFMEGMIITNAKMLSIAHAMLAGYWVLRSLHAGYLVMGSCALWFILAVLLCCRIK